MKTKLMLVAAAVVFTTSLLVVADVRSEEPAVADVLKAQAALTDAFIKGDANLIRTMMTDDKIAITPHADGPQTKAQQIETLSELKIAEYSPGKIKATVVSSDVVLLTYPLTLKGSYRGKPLAAHSYVSSLWVKRDGRWQEALYQETAL